MWRSKVIARPMEVRVTPHSSLSSWDERRPEQTKAKQMEKDEGREKKWKKGRRKGKMTKKSERSCQLPANEDGELILKGKAAGRKRKEETREQKKKRMRKKKENYKMFLPYRHKIGWRVEDCQRSQKPPITHTRLTETWGISSGRYDCYLLVSGLLRERIKRSDTFLSRQQIKPLKTVSRFKNTEVSLVQYTNPTAADKMSARDSTNKEGKKM